MTTPATLCMRAQLCLTVVKGWMASWARGLVSVARCRNNQPKNYCANWQLPIASYLTGVVLSSAQDKVVLWLIFDRLAYVDFSLPCFEFISLLRYHWTNTSIREEKGASMSRTKLHIAKIQRIKIPSWGKGGPKRSLPKHTLCELVLYKASEIMASGWCRLYAIFFYWDKAAQHVWSL